jgi:hypothetical protein
MSRPPPPQAPSRSRSLRDPERLPDGAHHFQHFDDGGESETTPLPLHKGQHTLRLLHETDGMNAIVRLLLHPLVEAGEAGLVPIRLLRI